MENLQTEYLSTWVLSFFIQLILIVIDTQSFLIYN